MPSLLGSTVAANYGRMTAQQTYGIGQAFTNFATRQLRLIKVTATANKAITNIEIADEFYEQADKEELEELLERLKKLPGIEKVDRYDTSPE